MAKFNEVQVDADKDTVKLQFTEFKPKWFWFKKYAIVGLLFIILVYFAFWVTNPPQSKSGIAQGCPHELCRDPKYFAPVGVGGTVPYCDISREYYDQINETLDDIGAEGVDGVILRTTLNVYESRILKDRLLLTCQADFLYELSDIDQAYEDNDFAWFQARSLQCELKFEKDESRKMHPVLIPSTGQEELWLSVASEIKVETSVTHEMFLFRYGKAREQVLVGDEVDIDDERVVEGIALMSAEDSDEASDLSDGSRDELSFSSEEFSQLIMSSIEPSGSLTYHEGVNKRLREYQEYFEAKYVPGVRLEHATRTVHILDECQITMDGIHYPPRRIYCIRQ